jgi:hypothetical protein
MEVKAAVATAAGKPLAVTLDRRRVRERFDRRFTARRMAEECH